MKVKHLLTPENIRYFLLLNLGQLLTALGTYIFKTPNHLAMGGTTGLSIIASSLIANMNVGTFMLILNAVLVALGLICLDFKTMAGTIYSSFALSIFITVLEWVWPLSAPLTDDLFLEFCFAVILPAAGSAILFNIGASSGGTDIIALILAKHTSLEIGKSLFVSDFLIALAAGALYGPRICLYCVLGLLAKAFVMDGIIDGINVRKYITIVSHDPEPILDFIMKSLHRSATIYEAQGAYTHEPLQVISTVLSRREAMLLRNYIKKTDPKSFITIVNSSETIGKGFRSL
ncbi:MAG TPA: YitT family protein [Candidatus Ruthenibacterium merdavium]|uniref:YitT family protein n=1 Tax=Candidatus Ruthenibacterium merdavium TaxID=2838752 RepID=A0A9D2Q518_9FIRM|nr:YitT family protein [Candidatus Ruthenibacterium merdavium]